MQEQHDIEETVTDENNIVGHFPTKQIVRPSRPITTTPHRYHVNKLSEDQCRRFKAAGVLVLAKEPGYRGKTVMLLGKENRTKNKRRAVHKPYWLHFSGKREIEDRGCPQVTALRELNEETAGCLAKYWPMIVEQVYHDSSAKIWDEPSCYVLFIVYLPFPDPEIPSIFRYIKDEFQPPENYQTELGWVRKKTLRFTPILPSISGASALAIYSRIMQALWRTIQDVTVEMLMEHLESTLNIQVEEDFEGHSIIPPSEPLEIVDIVNDTSDDPVMETDMDRSLWRGFNWEHVWLYGKGWFVFVWDTNKENAAIKAVETLLERYEYLDRKDESSNADDFHLIHYKNGKKRVYMSEDEKRLDAVSSLLKNPCWVYSKPLNVAGGQDFGYESIIILHQHELCNSSNPKSDTIKDERQKMNERQSDSENSSDVSGDDNEP